MALFEVEGWGLENKKIKLGGVKQKKLRKNKKEKPKPKQIEYKDQFNDLEEFEEDVVEDEPVAKANDKSKKRKLEEQRPKPGADKKKQKKSESKPEPKSEPKPASKPEPQSQPNATKLTPLQQKMMAKLSGSRFRYINEKLYTITSEEALQLIKEQPNLFDVYHEGFKGQVQSWPENPVDVFVNQIKQRANKQINAPGGLPGLKKTRQVVIADMGCGELQLSLDVSNFVKQMPKKHKKDIKVHSFDLKKLNERITVADVRNVPLESESCSIVIFCLLLMGTNFLDFIKELHRLLIPRGELWISEIKSRFADKQGEEFVKTLKLLGFFHKTTDDSNKMFTRFEFFKPAKDILDEKLLKLQRHNRLAELEQEQIQEFAEKRLKLNESEWLLKPCIYKRR